MILSHIIFTNVFGQFISIFNSLIQKEMEHQADIYHMFKVLNFLHKEPDFLYEMRQYFDKTGKSREHQKQLSKLMSDLPESKQIQIVGIFFKPALLANPVIRTFLTDKFQSSFELKRKLSFASHWRRMKSI